MQAHLKHVPKSRQRLAILGLIALYTACTVDPRDEDFRAEPQIEAAPQASQEDSDPKCLSQFVALGEAIRDTVHAIEAAEDEHEIARQAFVASGNRDDAERALIALNNQSFRLSGLYAALAADASTASTTEFSAVADRFASASRDMSVAYANAAIAGSPEQIIASRPVMDAAWRALGSACPD